jgi:transposase InsO family protein
VLREISVAEQRYQAVLAVLQDGLSVTAVAEKMGVSRQTLHKWLAWYAGGGIEELADRSHRPQSCPHQMDPAVEVRLVELRQAHPGWGPDRLRYRLAKERVSPLPSRAGIARALVRRGLISDGQRRHRQRVYRRWERSRPMELWQFDVVGGLALADGGEAKAVTGIDDHSRFCVAAGVIARATARPVCAVFADALARYGVPDEVLTDNGKVFTNRLGLKPTEVLFDKICRENGITHRLTAPRSPTTTGKIERFHGTLRRECLAGRVFISLAEAQQAIDTFVLDYNNDRPNQAIGNCTPAERFAAQEHPPGPLPVDLSALAGRRTGDDWVTRTVAANGIISVAWQVLSVGKHYGGTVVDVHVSDQLLDIWSGNTLIKTVLRESKGDIRKKRAQRPTKS